MRLLVRAFFAAFGLAAVAATLLWLQPEWLLDQLAARYPGCLYRVPTDRRVVALTLDDGPDSLTPSILDELRQHSARATFFLLSSRVPGHEATVRRIVREGHELANHGTTDRAAIRLAPDEFAQDLADAKRALEAFGRVRWARPGSGWYSQRMVVQMGRSGHRCALGSVYPFDAAIPWSWLSRRHLLANVRPGAIIVLHEGGGRTRRTLAVLRDALPELRARGYQVVTLSELIRTAPGSRAVQRKVPGLTSYTR
jgi:peptidoglycan-N-acetylglucosamine deacetylase